MVPRKILIVDSSIMVRRLLTETITGEQDLELVGSASSSGFALAKVASTSPDAVIVDIDSAGLDGVELITELRGRFPLLQIVVCSTSTDRKVRRQVFAAGALDFITRPACALCRTSFRDAVRAPLLTALRRGPPPVRGSIVPEEVRAARYAGYPEVCVVGASTDGPNALSALFQLLPRPEVPIVVVQHMPPVFTTQLAKRLSGESAIPFVEAEDGMRAEPRRGYIAPGDFHVHIARDSRGLYLTLSKSPPRNSVRPSVDVLFASAVEACRERVLGVVLTGMGQDGCGGCGLIRALGGQVVVQDAATSVVWGMPGAVVSAGLADCVVPLQELADELMRRLPFSRRTREATRGPRSRITTRVPRTRPA